MEVKLDLSNYATKADIKNVTRADTSIFAKKVDLVSLKSEVDKLDTDKLEKDVYNAKIKDIEDKIPDSTNLATNTALNAKINEAENKIPNITNSATTTALTAVENKILDHSKYITTPEFNKTTAENATARLKQANLANSQKRQISMIN